MWHRTWAMNVNGFTKYFIPIYWLSIKVKIPTSKVDDGPYGRRSCRDNNELITLTWTPEKLALCALRKWHGIISVILSKSQFKKSHNLLYQSIISLCNLFFFPTFFFTSIYFICLFIFLLVAYTSFMLFIYLVIYFHRLF